MLKGILCKDIILKEADHVRRRNANRDYLMSLNSEALLLFHKLEAIIPAQIAPEDMHGGWESSLCQLRGHFLGHWLSAAAMHYAATGDAEVKAKADKIVQELAACQQENGGEWLGSIPEKYLHRIAAGKGVWAPQYNLHKTFMGLLDMYLYAGSDQALNLAVCWSHWFVRWSGQFTKEQFDDILDVETGGMLEIWAILYGITGDKDHRLLMDRYYRSRLFDPLIEGRDVLTNMHANTTIPEVLGASRAYEVTQEPRWLEIVEAYWRCAVEERGQFCTGGQTSGEIWTPKQALASRLGEKTQEHCTVYNMMRLAEFLLRVTGDAKYADYWEQNLYNGIFAQGYWKGSFTHGKVSSYPEQGLLTYFLPLNPGATKAWSSKTQDFFCCHGTLVQANASHHRGIYYQADDGIRIYQYIDSEMHAVVDGSKVSIRQHEDTLTGSGHNTSTSTGSQTVNEICARYLHNPDKLVFYIYISCDRPTNFNLELRIPWWTKGQPVIQVNGEILEAGMVSSSMISINRNWQQDCVRIELPRGLSIWPLPDYPEMAAFLYGPMVLAGRCSEERTLYGDKNQPESILYPDNEREWSNWKYTYKTRGQDPNISFVPLYQIGYEPYTVYFHIRERI